MSKKNYDNHNRWRNKTVAFRVSAEEDLHLEALVKLTGLTKQDYITRFSIPTLTEVEKRQLLSQRDLAERNCMIWEKYGIQKEQIPTD